jgi:hypothetical protein
MTQPPKAQLKPLPPKSPAPPTNQLSSKKIVLGKVPEKKGHRIVLYGTGGIGKTSAACTAPGKVAFMDADESLSTLRSNLIESGIEMPLVISVTDWKSMREALQSEGYDGVGTIVIDSITKVEEWCIAHTIATVKHEKGHSVKSLEDYGFGKGLQHVFETFLPLLGDLDRHVRAGRNIILVAHECTSTVPNPKGDDWLRYEPRLQNPKSGANSIRLRLKEWADHVLFFSYDVVADGKKKGQGSGSRTLYCQELPFCMAKSRTCAEQIDIAIGASPWDMIIK